MHSLLKFLRRLKTHWPVTFIVFCYLLLFIPLFQERYRSEVLTYSPFLLFPYVLHALFFYFLPFLMKNYSLVASLLNKWSAEATTCILGIFVIPMAIFLYVYLFFPLYEPGSLMPVVVSVGALHLGLFSCWVFYRGVLYFYNKKSGSRFIDLSRLFSMLLGIIAVYPVFLVVGSVVLNITP